MSRFGLKDAESNFAVWEDVSGFYGGCGGRVSGLIGAWHGQRNIGEFENGLRDGVARTANADGAVRFARVIEVVDGGQNERQRAWPIVFRDFFGVSQTDDGLCHFDVFDHDGEGFSFGPALDGNQVIDSFVVDGIGGNAVHRLCRKNDEFTVEEGLCGEEDLGFEGQVLCDCDLNVGHDTSP